MEDQDRAAVTHLLVSSLHLGLGATLTLLALAARVFPEALTGVLGFGRIQPMALTSVMVGWLAVALVGAAYHVLPRLTGTRLWNENLATLGGWVLGGLGLLGVAGHAIGWGDGGGPLGLPWWFDLAVAIALLIPLAVTLQTIRRRTETGVFPTLWFVVGGVVSLVILAFVAAVPTDSGLQLALKEVTFTAGFTTLWVTTVGTGIAFYVAVRATGNPLANRQLAKAGFWSLLFAGIWAGPAQIAFAPYPDWLAPMGAALTLALPVAALSNGMGIAQTVGRDWADARERPAIGALGVGVVFSLLVGVATSVATFESASGLLAFTAFWDGVNYLALFGVGGMFVAAWAYQSLPAMTGRSLADPAAASRQVRWTLWFVGGTGLLLMLSGVVAGVGMTGGAYSALGPDSWEVVTGPSEIFTGLAVLTGAGGFAAQTLFVLNVYRTLTSGAVTDQEVLVEQSA
ncbi:MAG TPA: cbb3-type cytochrome c oxidase subunit I [Acidimicrobiia bacterium]|nr:cbb3-type cytochrome c oxidase subunit I [Acidimicrobiia bacterium]